VKDGAAELTDAYEAVKDSYDSYESIVEDCLSNISESSAASLFKKTKLNGYCASRDKDAQAILLKANQLIATKRITSSETNAMSSLSDEMNEVLEEADSNNAEVQDSLTTLEELMELNQSAQDFMNKFLQRYEEKAQIDIAGKKRDKAQTPDAIARANADREKIQKGLDMVKGYFQ
jgi:hypothetical protein